MSVDRTVLVLAQPTPEQLQTLTQRRTTPRAEVFMRNVLAGAFSVAVASCFSPVRELECERDADCGTGFRCIAPTCTPVGIGAVGSPCTLDSDCSALGMGGVCKRFTSTGKAVYQGGYCSLRCSTGAGCPMGSSCTSLTWLGDDDSLCLQNCKTSQCRTPGYDCWSWGGAAACWIFPPPDAGTG